MRASPASLNRIPRAQWRCAAGTVGSLTSKTPRLFTLSLRRDVPGRSRQFTRPVPASPSDSRVTLAAKTATLQAKAQHKMFKGSWIHPDVPAGDIPPRVYKRCFTAAIDESLDDDFGSIRIKAQTPSRVMSRTVSYQCLRTRYHLRGRKTYVAAFNALPVRPFGGIVGLRLVPFKNAQSGPGCLDRCSVQF